MYNRTDTVTTMHQSIHSFIHSVNIYGELPEGYTIIERQKIINEASIKSMVQWDREK